MSDISISSLKEQAGDVPLIASIIAQLQSRAVKSTKDGKPFLDLVFVDSTGSISLKVWSNAPLYTEIEKMAINAIMRLDGEWTQNQYGVNGSNISWSSLQEDEIAVFLAGDPETRDKQQRDYSEILGFCQSMTDPRLKRLAECFFEKMGDRFGRTAAARKNHHAR
ncbi:MAG: hypothetical protein ACK49X_08095, partial [Akkermansiaceae bacterium]